MPHSSIKLVGGVVVNETPALNQAGIASSQLIRLKPDPQGLTVVEKLGGWSKFYGHQVTNGPVRALWAWQDTNSNQWLGYGTSNSTSAQLAAIRCIQNPTTGIFTASSVGNDLHDITPQVQSDSVPANFQTTAGSNLVLVTDPVISGVSQYDSVYVTTPVTVGGIVLAGLYAVSPIAADQYYLLATNVLGGTLNAIYTTVAAPLTVTSGTFTSGTPNTITLNWASPSYTFPVNEYAVVNGVVSSASNWNGTFVVSASTSTSVTLLAPNTTTSTWTSGGSISNYGTVPILTTSNGTSTVTVTFPDHGFTVGSTFYVLNQTVIDGMTLYGNYSVISVPNSYSFTILGPNSASSSATNFVNALSVTGGAASGTAVTLNFGNSTYLPPIITPTGGSSTSSHVTLTWSSPSYTFVTGQTIIVAGVSPSGWNGSYAVTSSTSTSVTYANTSMGSFVSAGTVQNAQFNVGANVIVAGVNPSAWNGYYTITAVTSTSVTYASTASAGSWVAGGSISDNGGDVDFVYSFGIGPPQVANGYGVGGYGVGGYGTGQVTAAFVAQNVAATNWDLDSWGNDLIALAVGNNPITYSAAAVTAFQPIYYWDATANQTVAQAISAGPPASSGVLVAMPQRQLIAWGSSFSGVIDPLLIRWCDVNNFNVWIAQITNQAGSFRLPSGAAIRGALQTPQQTIYWTDIEVWVGQYIGPPLVYSFNKVGQGCGLIARHARASLGGVVYWMGANQFFTLSGEGVSPLLCPIWDVAFQQLDLANISKITCAANSSFQEVAWHYPVKGGTGEVSNYVKYNVQTQAWDYGVLDRSAWIDVSVLGQPIGASPSLGYIYQHEISPDADGAAMLPSFTTGYAAMADGDYKVAVDQVWPDFRYGYFGSTPAATVQLTFNVTDYPGASVYSYGPYSVTPATSFISPRFRGRLMSFTVSSADVGTFWRLGLTRYRSQMDGKY